LFKFDDNTVVIKARDGQLTYQERLEFQPLYERGMLVAHQHIDSWLDFDLEFQADRFDGPNFIDNLRASREFDLWMPCVEGVLYSLPGCHWTDLGYDFAEGYFHIRGSTPYGGSK
jgi:hypothetical protein